MIGQTVTRLLLATILTVSAAFAQPETTPRRYWIFFTDKGPPALQKATLSQLAGTHLSERALWRRAKVARGRPLIDNTDLPIYPPYIDALRALGHEPAVRSRWLNGVSVALDPAQIPEIEALPFVRQVQPVARRRARPEPARPVDISPLLPKTAEEIDYGASLAQNALISVPRVHDLHVTGLGVIVGMLDTGFLYQEHEAFKNLRVLGEFDFINNDGVTRDEPADAAGQHSHGTRTLSTIAGFKEGALVGPAFDAAFYLAKTELAPDEIPAEEDYWVAGIEWLESQGADVVSSSLGYLDWYTYEDMDGNSAVTTRAADLAVAKGVVVVNSAGNEALTPWHYIIAPADGDSVIAVGAVNAEGIRVPFSSVGPTFDGRIKPDVMAMGASVVVADPRVPTVYNFVNGTSFSCPLTAGVVALILSAHPELTPMEVYEALTKTADRALAPDTLYGYGIIDAWDALLYHGPAFSNLPDVSVVEPLRLRFTIRAASKDGLPVDGVRLIYRTPENPSSRTQTLVPSGVENEFVGDVLLSAADTEVLVSFQLTDNGGNTATWPPGAPDSTFRVSRDGRLISAPGIIIEPPPPTAFKLYPNYPNPFNGITTIEFDLPEESTVSLTVYNVLGQRVRRLLDSAPLSARRHTYIWDARNDRGERVSGGVYFYLIEAGAVREARRMLYLP